ncbi:WD40/YVTN repeat-like containing protein [Gracilaria domingensis]|nr:WD40/YVTN repeat-like containing protein [Gracilaria domingensis]
MVDVAVEPQHFIPFDSIVCCVRYSWDGKYLATGSDNAAHVFDANTARSVASFTLHGHKERYTDPYDDDRSERLVRSVCFSPNGEYLVTGAEGCSLNIWDIHNRTLRHRLSGHGFDIQSIDVSANGRFLASGADDNTIRLWNLHTGDALGTLSQKHGPFDWVTSVAVSPCSQQVAAASYDQIARVWDVQSSQLLRHFQGHTDKPLCVAFSPSGRLLISGGLDRTIKLWDLAMKRPVQSCPMSFEGHSDFVLSVTFSPDGERIISGSRDGTIRMWDPRQPDSYMSYCAHQNSVIGLAHSPVDRVFATGSGDCGSRTWIY